MISSQVLPRTYCRGFCEKLCDLYEDRGLHRPDLRHKYPVDLGKSDKDLFAELPMGDIWIDAKLHQVWVYLFTNRRLKVPDSWHDVIWKFHHDLMDLATGLHWRSETPMLDHSMCPNLSP